MKMTSAIANKMLKKLENDKSFWNRKEAEGAFYVAALDEEPVIPDYDYAKVAETIAEIDEKVLKIKHAINLSNVQNTIEADGEILTIDMVLVKLAQLNKRVYFLDRLRKEDRKTRVGVSSYSLKKTNPEYQYANYDIEMIKAEYEKFSNKITALQIALDKYNQTVEFEVEL